MKNTFDAWRETPMSPDLWEPDVHDLLVEAPEKGDGVAVAGRVSSITKAVIQEIVQSSRFRFRTENELVRTAVEYFLQRMVKPALAEDSPASRALVHRGYLLRAAALQDQAKTVDLYVDRVRGAVRLYLGQRRDEKAIEVLASALRDLKAHPDQEWVEAVERAMRGVPSLQSLWGEAEIQAGRA